jgi:hypothetical protein
MRRAILLITLFFIAFSAISSLDVNEYMHQNEPGNDDGKVTQFQKIPDHESILRYQIFTLIHNMHFESDTTGSYTLDSLVSEAYNSEINQWVRSVRNEYSYNTNGNATLGITSKWNSLASRWEKEIKHEISYNSSGNPTLQMEYEWIESSGVWIKSVKTEYEYNSEGYILSVTESSWNQGMSIWENRFRNEFSSNSDSSIFTDKWFIWDEAGNNWINSYMDEYTCNPAGRIIRQKASAWNSVSSQWVNYMKHEYAVDEKGLFSEIIYNWEAITNQWVTYRKNEFTYDSYGNKTEQHSYFRNAASNLWKLYSEEKGIYSDMYSINELIIPWYYNDLMNSFNHMLIQIIGSEIDNNTGTMHPSARATYYY